MSAYAPQGGLCEDCPPAVLRTVEATRYVMPLREGGSLPGLVEADDDGLYVVKFRGAGQGPKALAAELVCAALARQAGLPVPEVVLVQVDPLLASAEPDWEIQELLERSGGLNVGIDFLPGALTFNPAAGTADAELAADIVWFDALITNVDRTPRNPNLLEWHHGLHLIDHGAALYLQHAGLDPDRDANKPFPAIRDHVLLPFASQIAAAHERLAARLRPEEAAASVPDDWAAGEPYGPYLVSRLERAAFVEEADRARP